MAPTPWATRVILPIDMIQKVAIAVVLSLAAMVLGGYLAIAGFGVVGNPDITTAERIMGSLGEALFLGAPTAAAFYLVKAYNASKRTQNRTDTKALIALVIGLVVIIGAFPALLLGEYLSERVASWRYSMYQQHLAQKDEAWKTRQRNTVCVTASNVSYDFEFGSLYSEYELAYQDLRNSAPQSVRSTAADIIDNQIKPAYALCAAHTISPAIERERLKAAFDSFVQLAKPYRS